VVGEVALVLLEELELVAVEHTRPGPLMLRPDQSIHHSRAMAVMALPSLDAATMAATQVC
jgi:hypothetical protein